MKPTDELKFSKMVLAYYMECGAKGFAKANPKYVEMVDFIDGLMEKQSTGNATTFEGVWIEKKWLDGLIKRAERLSMLDENPDLPGYFEAVNILLGYISSIERKSK